MCYIDPRKIEFKNNWEESCYESKPISNGTMAGWRRELRVGTGVGSQGHGDGNRRAELRPEAVARSRLPLDTIYGWDFLFGWVG